MNIFENPYGIDLYIELIVSISMFLSLPYTVYLLIKRKINHFFYTIAFFTFLLWYPFINFYTPSQYLFLKQFINFSSFKEYISGIKWECNEYNGKDEAPFYRIINVYGMDSVPITFYKAWKMGKKLPIHLRYATSMRLWRKESGLHWIFLDRYNINSFWTTGYCYNKTLKTEFWIN
jgi:hypothetical protein